MKKYIIAFCTLIMTLSTFAVVEKLDNCSLDATCDSCFRETQYLYTCNPQQSSCQKDTVT